MVIKIIAIVLAAVIVITAGYMIVKTVINLFSGYNLGQAFSRSWNDIITLWGLIKQSTADIEIPMANQYITWTYANASTPR